MSTRSFWWFSEFKLTPKGIVVRKNGRTLTREIISLREILKWLGYYLLVRSAAAARRFADPHTPRIWFEPDKPQPWYVIWAAASWAGFRFARSEATADLRFHFEDATWTDPAAAPDYINGGCTDISKSRVAMIFEQAFGYPLSIDPRHHNGSAVEKSEINGAHDGRIVRCPCVPQPGKCYEKLVDATQGTMAIDWRTSIVDGKPVAIVRKTKPAAQRFSIHNASVKFVAPQTIFASDEMARIERFCAAMKLDWGALDILRDADGRIYIVDVNKTDTGPAVDLTWRDRIRLTSSLAKALQISARRAPQATSSCPSMPPLMASASAPNPVATAKE